MQTNGGGYFPAGTAQCPTFSDSLWQPLLDGENYLRALDAQLDGVLAGDTVLIAGLSVDPHLDLFGRRPGEPGYVALGDRLATLAAAGVTVRVLIAGKAFASSVAFPTVGIFRTNMQNARTLRDWRPVDHAGPSPLAGCVLVDFSGALIGTNHQKVVVVGRDDELTAYVGGIDLEAGRFDASPHDRLSLDGARWGWHDAAVCLRGSAAARVHDSFGQRWREAAALPVRHYLRLPWHLDPINPAPVAATLAPAPAQKPIAHPETEVRVLRSVPPRRLESVLPWRRIPWRSLPPSGVHEVFDTLVTALSAARRYIYIEDQYLQESFGGHRRYELYPYLRAAARRGVKVILVGSGTRDPGDPGFHLRPINRTVNRDLRTKIIDRLSSSERSNVAVMRVEGVTVHAKLVMIDDAFASIGSANMFSRSMSGVDLELSAAVTTATTLVRDLRVRVWAEHLRLPLSDELRRRLENLDTALGMWRTGWQPDGTGGDGNAWPDGFATNHAVLRTVELGPPSPYTRLLRETRRRHRS